MEYRVLFDGYCILCSRFAATLIKRCGKDVVLTPMQSHRGEQELKKYGLEPDPDEVILISNESVFKGASAVLLLMKKAGGFWRMIAWFIHFFPNAIISRAYSLVARNRYGWFGKRDVCYRPLEHKPKA